MGKNTIFLKSSTRGLYIGGQNISPYKSIKLVNHSPDGFSWGYGGSGPSQLALAILAELLPEVAALAFYQDFKRDIISMLSTDSDHTITIANVEQWLKDKGCTLKVLRS